MELRKPSGVRFVGLVVTMAMVIAECFAVGTLQDMASSHVLQTVEETTSEGLQSRLRRRRRNEGSNIFQTQNGERHDASGESDTSGSTFRIPTIAETLEQDRNADQVSEQPNDGTNQEDDSSEDPFDDSPHHLSSRPPADETIEQRDHTSASGDQQTQYDKPDSFVNSRTYGEDEKTKGDKSVAESDGAPNFSSRNPDFVGKPKDKSKDSDAEDSAEEEEEQVRSAKGFFRAVYDQIRRFVEGLNIPTSQWVAVLSVVFIVMLSLCLCGFCVSFYEITKGRAVRYYY